MGSTVLGFFLEGDINHSTPCNQEKIQQLMNEAIINVANLPEWTDLIAELGNPVTASAVVGQLGEGQDVSGRPPYSSTTSVLKFFREKK